MSRTLRSKRKTRETVRDGTQQRPSGSCNNNGGCPICEGNRLHKFKRAETLSEMTAGAESA